MQVEELEKHRKQCELEINQFQHLDYSSEAV